MSKDMTDDFLNQFAQLPISRKLAATLLTNKFACIWVDSQGNAQFVHSNMNAMEMAFATKIIDIETSKMVLPSPPSEKSNVSKIK